MMRLESYDLSGKELVEACLQHQSERSKKSLVLAVSMHQEGTRIETLAH